MINFEQFAKIHVRHQLQLSIINLNHQLIFGLTSAVDHASLTPPHTHTHTHTQTRTHAWADQQGGHGPGTPAKQNENPPPRPPQKKKKVKDVIYVFSLKGGGGGGRNKERSLPAPLPVQKYKKQKQRKCNKSSIIHWISSRSPTAKNILCAHALSHNAWPYRGFFMCI